MEGPQRSRLARNHRLAKRTVRCEPCSVSSKLGPWLHPDFPRVCREGCVGDTVHCMEKGVSGQQPGGLSGQVLFEGATQVRDPRK